LAKSETGVDALIDHDTHLLRFAYFHVQLGGQVARKYVQSDGRECAMLKVEQASCQIMP
jgi:hypothetical protein